MAAAENRYTLEDDLGEGDEDSVSSWGEAHTIVEMRARAPWLLGEEEVTFPLINFIPK